MPPTSIYTISQVTGYIKSLFMEDLLLGDLWLLGEVSNFTQAVSGHCYFTLKDAKSSIKSVIWRTAAANMALPRNGEQVIAHGYVSVYEQAGAYQFYVNHLEPAGVGQLWQAFERLKARLEAEGLFDAERKRPIPPLPTRLGIVTSATAAALRDILRTLTHRYPLVDVITAPTLVQGDAAPPGIVAAIAALNRWSAEQEPLDAIIIARGGGSIEELWAFNDERVARAIAASAVPVISGVGHETDFTITDFVADVRAPTPTGAAAVAVPDRRALQEIVRGSVMGASVRMRDRLSAQRTALETTANRLARVSPAVQLAAERQRIDELNRRAELAMTNRLAHARERLAGQKLRLGALDPTGVLARGYAIVIDAERHIVSSANQVTAGDPIHVRVTDGEFDAMVGRPR